MTWTLGMRDLVRSMQQGLRRWGPAVGWILLALVWLVAAGVALVFIVEVLSDAWAVAQGTPKHEELRSVGLALGGVFAAIAAIVGLPLAVIRTTAARTQARIAEQSHVTELFTTAVGQLGNDDSLAVRLGGIYSMERIARNYAETDHWRVMETLTAHVRENRPLPKAAEESEPPGAPTEGEDSRFPTDIQAILTVVGRRTSEQVAVEREGDHRINLSRAQLERADLVGANLQRTALVGANLRGAYLRGANLVGANLERAKLERAKLERANLEGAYVQGAYLRDANLPSTSLKRARLVGTNLERANLVGADLQAADLKLARLQGANLTGANLERANLVGANLEGAKLWGAKLQSANLEGAKLRRVDLMETDLKRADLVGANLEDAKLWGAKLEGANLEGANLRGAILNRVRGITKLPDTAFIDEHTVFEPFLASQPNATPLARSEPERPAPEEHP